MQNATDNVEKNQAHISYEAKQRGLSWLNYNWRLLELIDLSSKKLKSDENSEILIFNAEVVKTTIFEAKSSLLLLSF